MSLTVRRIRSGEGEALRTHRLAALLDTPSAFGSSHDAEVGRTIDEWNERAQLGAEGIGRITYFAVLDGEIVGLVGGFKPEPYQAVVDLVSMWTAPTARRSGAGRALVASVVGWARDSGANAVELWVTRGNEPAQRLYESCGFVQTGDVAPLPSDPCRDELRMRLVLGAV